jgi:arabinogalactan oligomer/maltooligosaccharide transport system substrate-binding protein
MNKRLIKKVMAVGVIGTLSVMAVGCTNGSSGGQNVGGQAPSGSTQTSTTPVNTDVSLTLWGAAEDQEMLQEMVEDFKAQNKDVNYTITLRVVGEDKAREEVVKDLDATADVFAIPHDQLGALVEAGMVYRNTKYAEEILTNVIDSAYIASSYNGSLYGYPSSAETYFLYYDTSIFTEEDVKSLDAMLGKDLPQGTAPLGIDIGNAYFSASFFLANDGQLFGEDGFDKDTVTFNDSKGLEVANYVTTLAAKGVIAIDDGAAASQFEAGKLGAQVTGPWKANEYKAVLGDRYGVSELPVANFPSGQKHLKSFAGFKIYCVKANTAYPLEAMELANFLTNEKNQIKRFQDRGFLPVNKVAAENDAVTQDETVAATLKQLNYSVAMPSIPQMSKFWEPTGAFMKDAFDGVIIEGQMQQKLDDLVKSITE